MPLRRLAALALALSMIQLNVAGADAMCAEHPTALQTAVGDAHAGMAHAAQVPVESETCQTPPQYDCCQALASCAFVSNVESRWAASAAAAAHFAVLPFATSPASTRSVAPEPPPPRA